MRATRKAVTCWREHRLDDGVTRSPRGSYKRLLQRNGHACNPRRHFRSDPLRRERCDSLSSELARGSRTDWGNQWGVQRLCQAEALQPEIYDLFADGNNAQFAFGDHCSLCVSSELSDAVQLLPMQRLDSIEQPSVGPVRTSMSALCWGEFQSDVISVRPDWTDETHPGRGAQEAPRIQSPASYVALAAPFRAQGTSITAWRLLVNVPRGMRAAVCQMVRVRPARPAYTARRPTFRVIELSKRNPEDCPMRLSAMRNDNTVRSEQ